LRLGQSELEAYGRLGIQPIAAEDVRETVAALVEATAYGLPEDWFRALRFGMEREEDPLGREIYRQLLLNAVESARARRPTCQDTGQAVFFIELGRDVHLVGGELEEAIHAGVAAGYRTLRASMVRDALFDRRNTGDNTPAVIHVLPVPGRRLTIHLLEKGYGSENKCFMTMYPYPNEGEDAVVSYVCGQVERAGAGWCPPGMLSVAVGGNFEQAPLLAKRALLEPFDMDVLLDRAEAAAGELTPAERLRVRLFREVNRLGIGPQGLGGTTTVLDVKLVTAPTHIAGLPIAVNVQCNKAHHRSVTLDGSGAVSELPLPDLDLHAGLAEIQPTPARRIRLPLDEATRRSLRIGERLLLSGRLLTARDAAHKRMISGLQRGEPLPVDLRGQVIYYVGPVPPLPGEVIGPAGPTTAHRMDPYTPVLLEQAGLAGTIGKGERGPETVAAIHRTGTVYMIAIGGAGYLQSRTIRRVRVLAYPDLGTEAIRELEVEDFPVIVAVDSHGGNLHDTGRRRHGQVTG
jgi:fumarate hydratase class I